MDLCVNILVIHMCHNNYYGIRVKLFNKEVFEQNGLSYYITIPWIFPSIYDVILRIDPYSPCDSCSGIDL